MISVGAVLSGVSIACITAGVLLLVGQVRRRPVDPVPSPSGNGSEPPRRAEPRPAARPVPVSAASSRAEVTRRRRILVVLLVAMVASLAAALVVRERWVWGVHLFVDDAFLGYVAWLARRAETRARAASPSNEPAVETRPMRRTSTAGSEQPEPEIDDAEAEVTDARA